MALPNVTFTRDLPVEKACRLLTPIHRLSFYIPEVAPRNNPDEGMSSVVIHDSCLQPSLSMDPWPHRAHAPRVTQARNETIFQIRVKRCPDCSLTPFLWLLWSCGEGNRPRQMFKPPP